MQIVVKGNVKKIWVTKGFLSFGPKSITMRKVYLLLLIMSAVSGIAQTKLISFKSHSGNMKYFRTAFENNLFDLDASDFGEPQADRYRVLDSVISISDTRSVFVYSVFGKTGRDTLNFPLLAKRHSLDSIKPLLIKYYHYAGATKDITFVSFDNNTAAYKAELKKKQKKAKKEGKKQQKSIEKVRQKPKQQIIPVADGNNTPSKTLLIVLLFALSGAVVFFSWKLNRFKTVSA